MTKKKEDLAADIEVAKEIGWFGLGRKAAVWDAMSRNTLADDLGEFEDSRKFTYHVEDATGERLLAHARQDAAMDYYAARAAYQETTNAGRWSWL